MEIIKYFLKSMRPEQWIKNFAVFAGLIFSGNLLKLEMILKSIWAFIIFSLISGAVYIINDIVDFEADQKHKEKSKRPIASGNLKVIYGLLGSVLLSAIAIISAFIINLNFSLVVLFYFVINILYSIYLKKIVIIDVLTISFDFVLRVLGGVLILSIMPTPWIIICTIFLSLFLALCKRRQEIILLKQEASLHREILMKYSSPFLDQLINFSSIAIVFTYILFTGISGKNINLMYTTPFVLYGVMRYLYLVYVENKTFSPTEAIAQDRPLQICVVLWVISVTFVLYF